MLITGASRPDPTYFGLKPIATAPRTILTTVGKDGEEPEFLSLKYYSVIQRGGKEEYVVKILSKEKLPDESIERLFGPGTVRWVYVHEVCLLSSLFWLIRTHGSDCTVENTRPYADDNFPSYQAR